jgi:hypothetical protein
MRVFTTHQRAAEPPMLVREAFSWAAFFFGFLYLAVHRAWLQAAFNLAAFLLVLALCRFLGDGVPLLGLAVLQGLCARDLRRWSLAQRGFVEGPVVAGRDRDQAFGRLIDMGAHPIHQAAGAAT